jgi:hypothetical protein
MMIIHSYTLITNPAMFSPDGLINRTSVAVPLEPEGVEAVQCLWVVDEVLLGTRRRKFSYWNCELERRDWCLFLERGTQQRLGFVHRFLGGGCPRGVVLINYLGFFVLFF